MRWIRFGILLVTAMVLQAGFLHAVALSHGRVRPQLLLILLVYMVLRAAPQSIVPASFLIGLGADTIGTAMGPLTLAYGLAGSLLGQVRRLLFVDAWWYQALMVTATGLLTGLLAGTLASLAHLPGTGVSVWGCSLYSGLIAPPAFAVLRWVLPGRPARRGHATRLPLP